MPDALKEQVFEHLARLAAVADLSEENRIAYDKALDRYRVSEIVNEDIRREGIEEGIKEGIKKGIEEGEKKKQLEIAREMKKGGMATDMIAKFTSLPIKDIEKL